MKNDRNYDEFMIENGFYQCEIDDFHESWRTRLVVDGKRFNAEFILTLMKGNETGEKSIDLYVKMQGSQNIFCLYDEDSNSFEHDLGVDGNVWNIVYDFCKAFDLNMHGLQYVKGDKCRDFELLNKR